jgi:predicted short-subunit dehydrogenase-like oxidoreductase (DUF2520 family)
MKRLRISFAGAGRVASALCYELYSKGHIIKQVVSPGAENGPALARQCDARWSADSLFEDSTDVIIVAVPDKKLIEVLHKIECGISTVVAHTAGSYGLEVFPSTIKKQGVLYPLQTFSKGRQLDFSEIPVFIEYSDRGTGELLRLLAESAGSKIYSTDTDKRRLLHVAAVFASNFPNHLLTLVDSIAGRAGFSLDIFKSLIFETVRKAVEQGPADSQTGPAIRNDLNTVEKHLELLSFSPEIKRIYGEMTRSITGYYKENRDE